LTDFARDDGVGGWKETKATVQIIIYSLISITWQTGENKRLNTIL